MHLLQRCRPVPRPAWRTREAACGSCSCPKGKPARCERRPIYKSRHSPCRRPGDRHDTELEETRYHLADIRGRRLCFQPCLITFRANLYPIRPNRLQPPAQGRNDRARRIGGGALCRALWIGLLCLGLVIRVPPHATSNSTIGSLRNIRVATAQSRATVNAAATAPTPPPSCVVLCRESRLSPHWVSPLSFQVCDASHLRLE